MNFSPAFLDELRARTLLSGLIGKTVKLQRAGREWRACCPFHQEKTASFYINDDKGFYHCFGCSAHGDAIRWLTDQRGLSFPDAVKELAQAAGLELPAFDPREARRTERARGLHEVMAEAGQWFVAQLQGIEGADARRLLERRGIRAETAHTFGLGFAPDGRGLLRRALAAAGDALLVEAGLLIQVEGKEPYDRFRGRLMIPIRDPRGRVIAFGGRVIGHGEPKYLNSPDTPLFDKGRILYNLDRALPAARKAGRVIAVEGYMDVIALTQAGFGEAVAPLGTALTEQQIERLWRIADVPLLCFDGDAAGRKAAVRAAQRALPLLAPGRSLAFVALPDGQDPDDLVRSQGASAFTARLDAAIPLVELLWQQECAAEPLNTPEARAGLKRRLHDLAGRIGDNNVRYEYSSEFRRRCDALFAPAPRSRGAWQPPQPPVCDDTRALGASGIVQSLARAVLVGLLRHPEEIARHAELLGSVPMTDIKLNRLFAAMVDAALTEPALDSEALHPILARSGLDSVVNDLLRARMLPFSFTRTLVREEGRVRTDLNEAIAVLAAVPAVDAALVAATAQAADSESAFERQVMLVRQRRELEARLTRLMLDGLDDEEPVA